MVRHFPYPDAHSCPLRCIRWVRSKEQTPFVWRIIIALIVSGFPNEPARGGDLSNEPVSTRIVLAKQRILVFTDANARQASAALPMASSTNPAADDFRIPPVDYNGFGLGLTSDVFFNNGVSVTGLAAIGAMRLPEAGTITAAYVRLDSHEGNSRQGDQYALRSNELFLGYAHRVAEFLAIGGEVQISDSTLDINNISMGVPSATETESLGAGFNLGAQMALSETFMVGLHGGVKWDRADTVGSAFIPGPVPVDISDTIQTSEVRAGLGWRPVREVGLYSDWQYLHMDSDLGTTEVGRWYLGGEVLPTPQLALRAGAVLDTQPQLGIAAGVGYYGIQGVPIELAYAYNTFPEVRREFGRAHLISFSVVFLF